MSDADALASQLIAALEGGALLEEEGRQRLLAEMIRLYARRRRESPLAPFVEGSVAVEDIVLLAAEMLKAADVTSFELAALFNV